VSRKRNSFGVLETESFGVLEMESFGVSETESFGVLETEFYFCVTGKQKFCFLVFFSCVHSHVPRLRRKQDVETETRSLGKRSCYIIISLCCSLKYNSLLIVLYMMNRK
jgi:hypothetical protein